MVVIDCNCHNFNILLLSGQPFGRFSRTHDGFLNMFRGHVPSTLLALPMAHVLINSFLSVLIKT